MDFVFVYIYQMDFEIGIRICENVVLFGRIEIDVIMVEV